MTATHQLGQLLDAVRAESMASRSRVSRVVVKTSEARILAVGMAAATEWKEHAAAGRVVVHVIAGRIRMRVGDAISELAAGELVTLEPGQAHDVCALEDAAFVLMVAGPVPATAGASNE
jgi:quercetin dioxygenase-like cupin family protein